MALKSINLFLFPAKREKQNNNHFCLSPKISPEVKQIEKTNYNIYKNPWFMEVLLVWVILLKIASFSHTQRSENLL